MPTLTGLNPNSPTPGNFREFVWAAGASSGLGSNLPIVIFANKTSAGSETVDVLGDPVVDDDDCVLRFGRRSEAYHMYRKYVEVDPAAEVSIIAVTESGGTASTRTITFAGGNASDTTTCTISLLGETCSFSVVSGDTAIVQAAACVAAINAADGGNWPVTAAIGGGGSEHIVTVTTANKGPRSQWVLFGLRATYKKSVTTTATVGATGAGTTEDDGTSAFAAAAAKGEGIWVLPWTTTTTVTATDNQLGEAITNIKSQALPVNGNQLYTVFAVRGTQAQAVTTASDTDFNSTRATCVWAEDNDWPPCAVAAHVAAIIRSEWIAYPAANINGYTSNDTRKLNVPDPFDKTDRPTSTEIDGALNGGVTPIAFRPNGSAYLVRHVTTRSLNDQGNNDYRSREGHIPRAIDFAWEDLKGRLESQNQPNVADNPAEGQKPTPLTTTPNAVKAIAFAMIDDLAGPNPQGKYPGPILAPDKIEDMKRSVVVSKATGEIGIAMGLFAVEHLIKTTTKAFQLGAQY